jgi:FkbM family methyltransferase
VVVDEILRDDFYGLRTARLCPRVVLDIGAHIGAFSRLAQHAWPEASLVACEPLFENLEILRTNLAGYLHAKVVPSAILAENAEEVVMPIPGHRGDDSLHDMHGNVWEWCRDSNGQQLPGGRDPEVMRQASSHVFRGGSWFSGGSFCRSAYRGWNAPGYRVRNLGFRLAAVPDSK